MLNLASAAVSRLQAPSTARISGIGALMSETLRGPARSSWFDPDRGRRRSAINGAHVRKKSIWNKYGFLWVTLVLFLGSLLGHWVFAWYAYVNEQITHAQPIEFAQFFIETARDTLENWQSEFLQLIWQVAGLAILLHIGSPQSKEGDARKEEKLDYILNAVAPDHAETIIRQLNDKYPAK